MGLLRRKKAILREMSTEIENGFVKEENLERLEFLEEILLEEGSEIPESMKEAYRQVAMECTVRCLFCEEDGKISFIDAIRRIWTNRVMALCDEDSSLVTRELKEDCQRLKLALTDEKYCETVIEYTAKNEPLVSLKRLVSELVHEMGSRAASADVDSQDEAGEEDTSSIRSSASEAEGKGKEIVLVTELPELMPEHEQSSRLLRISNGEELDVGQSLPSAKTISSPIFDRVLKDLKASKQDMVNALEQTKASDLNDGSTEQKIVISSSQENAPKPTLMARSITAQTYEWEDSIDDSNRESTADGESGNISKRKKLVMSPLKRDGASKGPKKQKARWTTAETRAIMKGYEIHGPNWKLIKEANPILARRTNVDIKDKFRGEKRRREACGAPA